MENWKEERRKWAAKYGIKGIEFPLNAGLWPEHVELYNDDIIPSSDTGDIKEKILCSRMGWTKENHI